MDCSPPGPSVRGLLQARKLDGVPFPSPGDLPNPGLKLEPPVPPTFQADSLPSKPPEEPKEEEKAN